MLDQASQAETEHLKQLKFSGHGIIVSEGGGRHRVSQQQKHVSLSHRKIQIILHFTGGRGSDPPLVSHFQPLDDEEQGEC